MNIALTGTQERKEELKSKIGSHHNIIDFDWGAPIPEADCTIDLDFDLDPTRIQQYALQAVPVILSAVNVQLLGVMAQFNIKKKDVFGLNALPGFLDKNLWEMTAPYPTEQKNLSALFSENLQAEWVADRVGMVTPRILFMIINEAYYTVQEGTANKADINTGMKLGTAYPGGPFEWVEKIGLLNVLQTLDALYQDTRDDRYKICTLLKTEAMSKSLEPRL